jgi:nitrous oxidase accessory protein
MKSSRAVRIGAGVAAAGLVALSAWLPLWRMTMRAPQYPKGLRLYAFGRSMEGDLRELNILNHYIGMPPVSAPSLETSIFPIGIVLLAALCLLAPVSTWLRRMAIAATLLTPVAILVDLQWRLYEFGHSLNPTAPIRLKAFTPLVIGPTRMGNFVSTATISWGVVSLIAAAGVLWFFARRPERVAGVAPDANVVRRAAGIAAALIVFIISPAALASTAPGPLQARLDAAPRGGTVIVERGVHRGPIVIHGPLTVVGEPGAVIDGGGIGSVVTIDGDDVVLRGVSVRNSGHDVTEEAAGITVTGNRHRIEDNDVRDVYFGIHIGGGGHSVVRNNTIAPGTARGARPGHGISAWNLTDSTFAGNRISDARDGIYLSFTNRLIVAGNTVTRSRYGLHSMYSQQGTMTDNTASGNLLGAALMMSDRLVLRGNRIERHREGAAAYGVLLKDIGELTAEDNLILGNRIGIYAEGVAPQAGREALVARNVIAGNEVGLALQRTAALTVAGNRIADNLTDVRALGRELSPKMRWSRDGRGNFWGQYRGYDADGVGDVPYALHDAMDAIVQREPSVQAFLYTPAHLGIEAAARMFPLYRHEPVLVDARPLMTAPARGSR